jgi:hypothetical protein
MSAPIDQAPVQPGPAKAANAGPISDNDVNDWKERFNHVLGNAGETINSKSPEHAQDWSNSFFSCLSPIDTCELRQFDLLCKYLQCGRLDHLLRSMRYFRQNPSPYPQEWQHGGL